LHSFPNTMTPEQQCRTVLEYTKPSDEYQHVLIDAFFLLLIQSLDMTHASITLSQTSYSRIIKPLFHITVFPLETALHFHTRLKHDSHSAHTKGVSQPLCPSRCLITTFWIEMHWHKFNRNSRSVATAEKSCEALLGRCFFVRVWLSRYPKVMRQGVPRSFGSCR
jgi:hypothetical protein